MCATRAHLQARRDDPTRTKTARETYGRRLRGGYGRINAAIRQAVGEDDVLGLRDRDTDGLDLQVVAAVGGPGDLASLPPDETLRRFEEWLDDVQESEVLGVIERDGNSWIERAYERGAEDADTRLRQAGVDLEDALPVETALNTPTHERKLRALFARNYTELDGITNAVTQAVQRELADGIAAGLNPTEMARRLTDRVNAIGKTRATVLARTEVINAHSEATLTRYEEFDAVEGVTVRAEWATAGDTAVCPICASLEGQTFTIEEARTESFQFNPGEAAPDHLAGEYPVKPPLHPQCRCALLPVTGATAAAAVRAHPRAFHVLFAHGAFARDDRTYARLAMAETTADAQELVAQVTAT